MVFLDLATAFGSVLHNFLWTAFDLFRVPAALTSLIKAYFQDMQLCLMTADYTTVWQLSLRGVYCKFIKVKLKQMLAEASDPFVAQAAPFWIMGGNEPQQNQLNRHSSTGTSWSESSKGAVVLALGSAHQSGIRLLDLRDAGLWCKRYISRQRQQVEQRP